MSKRNKNTILIVGGGLVAVGLLYVLLKPRTSQPLSNAYNSPQPLPAYSGGYSTNPSNTASTVIQGATALTGLAKAISSLFGGGGDAGSDPGYAPVGIQQYNYVPSVSSGYSTLDPNAGAALNFLSGIGVIH